ncbi:hypothetical protein HY485_04915 [Candidatus Woesearchaeota archaeon]|nr:hypothetical protein [Candidatus Woesearchaeota archaeon]
MINEQTQLIKFAEQAQGLEPLQQLKLILFATGTKPSAYVLLKTDGKNLDEKEHFEQHLKHNNIIYETSKAKSYEEIKDIRGNTVRWEIKGTWHGYDLFHTKTARQGFHNYKKFLKEQKHSIADKIAGKLYGYPDCCMNEYTKEHNINYIKKKYTYYSFYKRMYENDRKFPFIAHYPCSSHCTATKKLNNHYSTIIRKNAPAFLKEYTKKHYVSTALVVDAESNVYDDNAQPLWEKKDAHDYSLITLKPVNKHHYMLSHLTKALLLHGTIVTANIIMTQRWADVRIKALKDFIKDFHHERKFLVTN